MSPILKAKAWWRAHEDQNSFEDLVSWCANHGYVYAGQDAFLAATTWVNGKSFWQECPNPDTWFIFVAASSELSPLMRFMDLAPFSLPFVSFHRRGVLRTYPWLTLKQKCYGIDTQTRTS